MDWIISFGRRCAVVLIISVLASACEDRLCHQPANFPNCVDAGRADSGTDR